MRDFVNDDRIPVEYDPLWREYYIPLTDGVAAQRLFYCPWSGDLLPESLRGEWFRRIWALGLEQEDEAIPDSLRRPGWWHREDE